MQFSKEVAWVTGSSKGIGRGSTRAWPNRTATWSCITTVARTTPEEVGTRIEALGRNVLLLEGEVTNTEYVLRMVREIEARFGRVDALAINAGSVVERTTTAEC